MFSIKKNAIDNILSSGKAIIKPARTGFLIESQLAKEITTAENNNFAIKMIMVSILIN